MKPLVAQSGKPNIILILTDDQRFDELDHMATVQSELIARGVQFTNGMISDPLCCPSRATILTGTYSHTNGIYTNHASTGGGFSNFHDATTIATVLQSAGYDTALIGKYLNEYSPAEGSYVPPGWNRWYAVTSERYYKFSVSDQGTDVSFTDRSYLTDILGQKAVDFINSVPTQQPLFLFWTPFAPHSPATPAEAYKGSMASLPPLRPPSYNEADVSDKPSFIRRLPSWTPEEMTTWDLFRQRQYESLLSVDDAVKSILSTLAATGRLHNSIIVFMSDNGLMLGEHRAVNKVLPYEESIRVPFIVRWDAGISGVPRRDPHLVANVDLAETFAAAARTTMPGSEGIDMSPLFTDAPSTWRTALLLEHSGPNPSHPPYCGVRTAGYSYAQYATGEEELYDLTSDRFQLQNVASDSAYASILEDLRAQDHVLCDPVPPGFIWAH